MIPWAANLGESILRGMRESAAKIKRSIKAQIHFTQLWIYVLPEYVPLP